MTFCEIIRDKCCDSKFAIFFCVSQLFMAQIFFLSNQIEGGGGGGEKFK